MLYRRDPLTLEHLIIDGDEVLRLRTESRPSRSPTAGAVVPPGARARVSR